MDGLLIFVRDLFMAHLRIGGYFTQIAVMTTPRLIVAAAQSRPRMPMTDAKRKYTVYMALTYRIVSICIARNVPQSTPQARRT